MLVAVDTSTAMLTTGGVQSKGPNDKHAVASMTLFIQPLGHTTFILRSDGELVIVAKLAALCGRVGRRESIEKVVMQSSTFPPEYGLQRTHSDDSCSSAQLCCTCNGKLASNFFLTGRPRHGQRGRQPGCTHVFYNRKQTNLTPFEKVHLKKYHKPRLMFGESGSCRRPGAQLNKLDSMLAEWLARLERRRALHLYGRWHRASTGDTTNGGGTVMRSLTSSAEKHKNR